ncbi:Beige protein-like 1 [Friedmanniomyces endolithicus]|nr:Beige protein-like 1 [Friedmanniomyces endolithicus]
MASQVGEVGRTRSSTYASRGLDAVERESATADLVRRLAWREGTSLAEATARQSEAAAGLQATIGQDSAARDVFRHAAGFETILTTIEDLTQISSNEQTQTSENITDLLDGLLSVLAVATNDHRGNQKYFDQHLDGWTSLKASLETFQLASIGSGDDVRINERLGGMYTSLLRLAVNDFGFDLPLIGPRAVEGAVETVSEATHEEPNATSSNIIEYPQAARIAVQLAIGIGNHGHDQSALTVAVLSGLSRLCNGNLRNKIALWHTQALTSVLEAVFRRDAVDSVRDAAQRLVLCFTDLGLGNLDDVERLFRQARETDEAKELLLAILQKSKGPAYVQFDLTRYGYSSIELPSFPRAFPPTTDYTLTVWVRIDTFDPNSHTTLFGAFDASQACFILIYLEQDSHQLILQTSVRSSRPSVRFKSTRFAADKWYHIALVHRKATTDSRQSPAILFVNGDFAEQVKCAYPEAPAAHDEKPVADSPGPGSQRAKAVQAFFGTPHDLASRLGRDEVHSKWSLASAHLCASALTDEFVAVQHRLGPGYTGNYQDCLGPLLTYRASAELNRYNELLHPEKADKSDIVTATESRGSEVVPESRLLLSLNASAVIRLDGNDDLLQDAKYELDRKAYARYLLLAQKARAIAINLAIPTVNEAISRSHGTGILTGDPVIAVPKRLDDATWSLAGCLPLVVRLLESASTKSAFLQAVRIYFECIVDNWRISEAMEKGNGFGMLAMIIREKLGFDIGFATTNAPAAAKPPSVMLNVEERQHLPAELLRLILDYVGYRSLKPEDSMLINPMAYRVLLVDFDTWRRCNLETQKLYFQQFVHFIVQNRHQAFNAKRLVRMRVVRKLIEALKSESISEEAVEPLMRALKVLVDNGSAGVLYKDLAMFVAWGLQDERAMALKPMRNLASIAHLTQRVASWARHAKSSRPSTPGGYTAPTPSAGLSHAELAIHVLQLLTEIVCDGRSSSAIRRFNKAVPNRWLLHLLAEPQVRVMEMAMRITTRSLATLGKDFKTPFVERNSGWVTLRSRLKMHWRSETLWLTCFAILFGSDVPTVSLDSRLNVFTMIETFRIGTATVVVNPEVLPTLMAMLETGLRTAIKDNQESSDADAALLKAIIQFLNELYTRSPAFQDFAVSTRYIQDLLFVLYPVLVGSDRLSAETELQADRDTLSFRGQEVKMRPHSSSLNERPPSVRSMNADEDKRTPSPLPTKRIQGPRRLSSFVMVNPTPRAQFSTALAPKKAEPVKLNTGNDLVEALLEVGISLFIDLICGKRDFQGIGLFLKVPPGFREHQAFFCSFLQINTFTQLWNHLKLRQSLLRDGTVLKSLSRYCQHIAEAVFEGWFIDGAQPVSSKVLDFTGHLLEYLQQPDVCEIKAVKLCSHHTSSIRVVFLRVTLWRLSELDDTADEALTVAFLDKMNYWQTILFSSENQETLFIRLICFLLYLRLVADSHLVRLAAARLWRTVLVHKPTTSATLLTVAMGAERRHLSTGFMKLVELDDEDFIVWVDENKAELDTAFLTSLNKPWNDFVTEENTRNAQTAQHRLEKRQEKLRQWQAEESTADDLNHRYEVATSHWRANVHAQERLKLSRATQDYHENAVHLTSLYSKMARRLQEPCSLEPNPEAAKWLLDETEAPNRMRIRTIRDQERKPVIQSKLKAIVNRKVSSRLAINTRVAQVSEDILSSLPGSPLPDDMDGIKDVAGRPRAASASSQLLEGGFEIVDDPKEDDDGVVEDKNRKIMTSLQRGDAVQQLYNISRIVGLEACEGLLVIGKRCLYLQDSYFQRSDGEIVSASQAPEDERDPYVHLISGKDIGSHRDTHNVGDTESRNWTWSEVLSVSKRRFLFRDVSVEVFFADGRSYLLTCISPKIRDDLYSAITGKAPHVHSAAAVAGEDAWRLDNLVNPQEVPQSIGTRFAAAFNNTPTYAATKKWMRGEMSNFQYLMLVNTLAGRTFNDLTQYPVFPWVLADYTSEELDLNNRKSFRDLSKPMGCQTVAREADYRDRYKQFAEMGDVNAPPFHYGTHYSSAMIVTSYLIRLQPFVQSYLLLQGGSFDHADRLFDSVGRAWLSASRETMSDVRELIPEFYCLPEAFVNINKYDFGAKQGGGAAVNDVQLPPWAKGDPHLFVAKHREALESPYVSQDLHKWIDLVFGYKQRGEAAVEATNVFNHLSYRGAKDLDTIEDPVERLATIGIVHSFGQTPHQVFQRPHPGREAAKSAVARLDTLAESLVRLPDSLFDSDERVANLTFSDALGRLLCAGPGRLELAPRHDRYMQWGFADNSIRFFSSNTKRLLGLNENAHIGRITAAVLADSKTLVTAGADCTIAVWTVNTSRDLVDLQPKTCLFGHRRPVTLLASSRVFSTLLSVSTDGQVLLWGLNRLTCVRVLLPAGGPRVQAARVSNATGRIVLCQGSYVLLFTINGHLLVKQKICDDTPDESSDDGVVTCSFYEGAGNEFLERELLFTGHKHGVANIWALTTRPEDGTWHLQLVKRLNHVDASREDGGNMAASITAILPMPAAVYTGDETGRVWEWDCVVRAGSGGGGRGR